MGVRSRWVHPLSRQRARDSACGAVELFHSFRHRQFLGLPSSTHGSTALDRPSMLVKVFLPAHQGDDCGQAGGVLELRAVHLERGPQGAAARGDLRRHRGLHHRDRKALPEDAGGLHRGCTQKASPHSRRPGRRPGPGPARAAPGGFGGEGPRGARPPSPPSHPPGPGTYAGGPRGPWHPPRPRSRPACPGGGWGPGSPDGAKDARSCRGIEARQTKNKARQTKPAAARGPRERPAPVRLGATGGARLTSRWCSGSARGTPSGTCSPTR